MTLKEVLEMDFRLAFNFFHHGEILKGIKLKKPIQAFIIKPYLLIVSKKPKYNKIKNINCRF